MNQLSPETIWRMKEKELAELLDYHFLRFKPKKIHFYAPSFMYYRTNFYCSSQQNFSTISITGKGCSLKCKHCGGKVLETMYPATTPEKLFELCKTFYEKGASGCLISGGCMPNGSVPLNSFIDVIGKIKDKLGLTVFVHTGIIDFSTAKKLNEAGVDAALIDIIGSNETIKEIYNLKITVDDYERSLKALNEAEIAFVPHVIVGLHYGKLKGELNALKMISKYTPSALVVIVFMPIHGTAMAKAPPPKPLDTAKIFVIARRMFSTSPLVLGCMRPKGKHRIETDILAIKAGVDAIAFPSEEAISFAKEQGYKIDFSSFCCAQVYLDMLTGSKG